MRCLFPLLATFSVAIAAVVRRDVDAAGDVQVSDRLSDAAAVSSVSTLTEVASTGNHVIELFLQKGLKGKYYYYTTADTDNYTCMNILRLVRERILSVRQSLPQGRNHVRCNYHAEPDCGTSRGKLTKTDDWEQPDLAKEPRKSGQDVLGSWEDQVNSFQCFWVRGDRSTEGVSSLLESTDTHENVLDTSNESALVDETSMAKHLELRAPSTHDNDRLTELYTGDYFFGHPISWATQRDAEREYCIKTNLPKGVFVRSIMQHRDSEDDWFVCWYYDDEICNSKFVEHGVFNAFYLERDQTANRFAYKIMSFKCHYADPSKRSILTS